jgi:hypothetical protein
MSKESESPMPSQTLERQTIAMLKDEYIDLSSLITITKLTNKKFQMNKNE